MTLSSHVCRYVELQELAIHIFWTEVTAVICGQCVHWTSDMHNAGRQTKISPYQGHF